MKEYNYPKMDDHVRQHEEFKAMLRTMVEDFEEEGATKALGASINTFLINWLVGHITRTDVEFGKFLNEKGLKFEE